jgi:hypothetical protein
MTDKELLRVEKLVKPIEDKMKVLEYSAMFFKLQSEDQSLSEKVRKEAMIRLMRDCREYHKQNKP